MKVAIVGAGWAGLAAAIEATQRGHVVSLFDTSRVAGGRARALPGSADGADLDNGQHILIGAYRETLRLMHTVGVAAEQALASQPLSMRFPDGRGMSLPDWPAPWDALHGICCATGWTWSDRWSLVRAFARWRWSGFACPASSSVSELCVGIQARVMEELIDPLCVSALNTPSERASGQVFLRVLQDALFGPRGSSHLLLPKVNLSRLFPEAAVHWLNERGCQVHLGHRVMSLRAQGDGWSLDGGSYDAVLLACTANESARLVEEAAVGASAWIETARALRYESIATVYAQAPSGLPQAMLALRSDQRFPAQFVFDRDRLGGQHGLLAFVVSASTHEREQLQAAVLEQAAQQLGMSNLHAVQTVVEKRATFACTPALRRPGAAIAPGLWACGDYVDGPYPATLEGAVRSGVAAALSL